VARARRGRRSHRARRAPRAGSPMSASGDTERRRRLG
jgi:hypothetical protein